MSNINNFSLVGVGSNVQFGKQNGFIQYSGTGFSVFGSNNTTLSTLAVANSIDGTHAITQSQVYGLVGSNTLTAGSGINFTAGVISTVVDAATILNSGGSLHVGTIQTSNIANNAITTALINNSAVTYAKLQNETAHTLLGNPTGGAAAPSEIALSANLQFSSGTLDLANNINISGTVESSNIASGASISGLNTGDQTITLTGDVTGSGTGSFATTLATVNSNVGSFALSNVTVNAKGLVTAASATTVGSGLSLASGTLSVHVDGVTVVSTGGSLSVGTISGNQVSGGTLHTTQITGLNNPVNATDAANKNYVDGVAAGLDSKQAVVVATTGSLAATYSSDVLTATGTGALVVDGYTAAVNDRILVKNQTGGNATQNGIYVVTTAGGVGTAYVLTRSTDMDATDQIPGAYTFVVQGSVNAGNGYVVTGFTESDVLDTNNINWTQFSQAGAYGAATAGGLSLDTSSVPALYKINFTNISAAGALGSANLVAISQDGTNVVDTTLGSLAAFIAGASVTGSGAIHVTSGTVSLTSSSNFTQTSGTLDLGTTGVTAGTYGNNNHTSIVTVDAFGRVTSASTGATALGTGSVTSVATGTGLTGGPVTNTGTISIATNGVSYALMQQASASKILGNPGTSTANVSEIGLAPSLNFIGSNLAVSTIGTTEVYVSTLGNDTTGDGSINNPYATYTHAISTITDNSISKPYAVHLEAGNYTDNVNVKPYVAIIGSDPTVVSTSGTISMDSSWSTLGSGCYLDIDYITFTAPNIAITFPGTPSVGRGIQFSGCSISGNLTATGNPATETDYVAFFNSSNVFGNVTLTDVTTSIQNAAISGTTSINVTGTTAVTCYPTLIASQFYNVVSFTNTGSTTPPSITATINGCLIDDNIVATGNGTSGSINLFIDSASYGNIGGYNSLPAVSAGAIFYPLSAVNGIGIGSTTPGQLIVAGSGLGATLTGLTIGSGLVSTGGTLSVKLLGTGGISDGASGLYMNIAGLSADGTALNSADLVALSHAGTTVSTTLGSLQTFITGGGLTAAVTSGSTAAALTFNSGTFTLNVDGATVVAGATGLSVGTIQTANINNSAVTYAKLQNESAQTLLGNPGTASAAPSEIGLGTALALNGGSLKILVDTASIVKTSGSLAVQLVGTGGIAVSGTGLYVNIAGLTAGTTVGSTDLVAISQGGTTVSTTVGALAATTVRATAIQGTFNSAGTAQTVGTLPSYVGFSTVVGRVVMVIGTAFSGGTAPITATIIAGGTHTLMMATENDPTVVGRYVAELGMLTLTDGGAAVVATLNNVGTAGQASVTLQFDLI